MAHGKYNAPAAIVVCCNLARTRNEAFSVQDCFAATTNILNTAPDFGLGTVWLATYGSSELMEKVHGLFKLPEDVKPAAVIYVGYPVTIPEERTQFEESTLHWEEY
jgi:nitroreductase